MESLSIIVMTSLISRRHGAAQQWHRHSATIIIIIMPS
jgi:hypothetical protein